MIQQLDHGEIPDIGRQMAGDGARGPAGSSNRPRPGPGRSRSGSRRASVDSCDPIRGACDRRYPGSWIGSEPHHRGPSGGGHLHPEDPALAILGQPFEGLGLPEAALWIQARASSWVQGASPIPRSPRGCSSSSGRGLPKSAAAPGIGIQDGSGRRIVNEDRLLERIEERSNAILVPAWHCGLFRGHGSNLAQSGRRRVAQGLGKITKLKRDKSLIW